MDGRTIGQGAGRGFRRLLGFALIGAVVLAAPSACKTGGGEPTEQKYRIVKPPEPTITSSGIPIDKQADIQLILQQREPTARKCYQDVLNEKHDRAFQGVVPLVIRFAADGHVADVKIGQSTLNSPEVEACLVEKIKEFEFPPLDQAGEVQYVYSFRPAY